MKNKNRFVKIKNPKKEFLCALCSAPRQMRYSKNLSRKNYLQIVVTSVLLSWLLFSFVGPKALFSIFFVWTAFEVTNKFLYRKEIPCPYCGFDATWYKRDIKLARKKVEEFWTLKSEGPDTSEQKSSPSAANS